LPRATQWLDSHERALIAFLDELARQGKKQAKAA
jgi:hypothetical protein